MSEETKPKLFYDHSGTIKKLLHVLVEDEILMYQVDMVLEGLRKAIYTSTAVQERWANFDYNGNGYKDLPLK
jgi:DNA-binding PadR family transcriptional regulator